jgi:hypothetical protein
MGCFAFSTVAQMLTVTPPGVNIIPIIPAQTGKARRYDNVGNRHSGMVPEGGRTKAHGQA